jgi:hypothetical protein
MSKSIPQVKSWNVTIVETGKTFIIDTINKRMVKIILGLDHPESWQKTCKISLKKSQSF